MGRVNCGLLRRETIWQSFNEAACAADVTKLRVDHRSGWQARRQRLPIGLAHSKPNLGFIRDDNLAFSDGGLKRRVIALRLVRVCQRKFAHSHVKLIT